VLLPLGIIYTFVYAIGIGSYKKVKTYVGKSLYIIAYGLDCIGNVVCRDLFNNILIRGQYGNAKYEFGRWTETISSVLGKNQQTRTLTKYGERLVAILDWIDPDHCKKSIQEF
jgi:hypothetical protein